MSSDLDAFLDEAEEAGPEMVAEGGTPPAKSDLDDALARGPIMAGDWWDAVFEVVEPKIFQVEGAKPLLYPGMSHVFIGEPGRGKSMLGQKLLVELAGDGMTSLFLDLEKDFSNFRERIRALGATKELAQRTGYWRLTKDLSDRAIKKVVKFCEQWRISVVVVDSVGRAISRAGLDENSNDDVRRWYDTTVEPLMRAGLTVVLVDHYKKPGGDTGGRFGGSPSPTSRYAKGAGAKMDVITGAAYGVETVIPFSKEKAGLVKIVTAKDNNGGRHEGEVAAEVKVEPSDGGRVISMTLASPEPLPVNADGSTRYTVIMEQVSRFVESAGESQSRTQVEKSVNGSATRIRAAIDTLVEEKFLEQIAGPHGAKLLTSKKAYRKDNDPKVFKQRSAPPRPVGRFDDPF